jgi:hypothetical protein
MTTKLLYFDSFDGTFIGGLLGGIFKLRRDLVGNDFSDFVAHLKNFRAGLDAQAAGSTAIVNSDFHNTSPEIFYR